MIGIIFLIMIMSFLFICVIGGIKDNCENNNDFY